jgi:hypothetical protein
MSQVDAKKAHKQRLQREKASEWRRHSGEKEIISNLIDIILWSF